MSGPFAATYEGDGVNSVPFFYTEENILHVVTIDNDMRPGKCKAVSSQRASHCPLSAELWESELGSQAQGSADSEFTIPLLQAPGSCNDICEPPTLGSGESPWWLNVTPWCLLGCMWCGLCEMPGGYGSSRGDMVFWWGDCSSGHYFTEAG